MKTQIKKRLAAAASLILAAAMLAAGCAKAGSGTVQESTENNTETSAPGKAGDAAKGRYMEEEIALPDEAAQLELIDCLLRDDRSLEFYFKDRSNGVLCYIYGKDGWSSQELPFQVSDDLKFKSVKDVMKGKDGNYYIGGFGEGYIYHLYAIEESGAAREIYEDVFRAPEGEEYGVTPDYLSVLSDGSLLVSGVSSADIYSKDGKKRFSMEQDYVGTDVRISAYMSDTSYLTLLNGQIVCYDTGTGEQSGSYQMIPDQTERNAWNMTLYEEQDKSIYVAGQQGLFHIGKNGTIWEQMIDGSLNSMGRQDIYLKNFYPGAAQDYYGVFNKYGDGGALLLHYFYDDTVDTVPPKTLTVYSLRDSSTVRQAAAIMQKNNPDVRVDFRIAVENEEEEVTEDVIRALNTELLNGKGADVLILDGLPMESYRKKGVLMDMGGVIEGVEPALIPHLTEGFTAEDGGIYYIPARVGMPVVYGEPEAAKAFASLGAMGSYDGNPPLLVQDTYGNLIRLTARTFYLELFDKHGVIKEGMIEKWLAAVKSAGEKSGFKSEYTPEEAERLHVRNYVRMEGFGKQNAFFLAGKKCPAAAELLTSIDNAMLTVAAAEMGGYKLENVGKTYIPATMAGINASTKQSETAGEFVKTLLGAEVQNEMLWDGFTVRNDSLELWAETEKDIITSVSSHGEEFRLEGGWPSRERRDEILMMVKSLENPVIIDESLIDMVVSGSRDYLDGKEPLEGAVQAIENQIRLYMAEKE